MIGHLRGRILEKQPPWLLLEVNGVGYEVEASMNTFYKLPELGAEVGLHTHFVVREDAQLLYGFADQKEKQLFRSLIKVNGVGPKMALAILSGISAEDFIRTVHSEDTTALVRVPGVGKKTAERLIVEMKDRLDKLQLPTLTELELSSGNLPVAEVSRTDYRAEAESALIALGYKPQQATRAIEQAAKTLGEGAATEDLIRQALKTMVTG
ncbi:Holliday junction branch migration protein RuvA [Marinobacterium sediminicola]|uniref:Holliday junction branch migration complex subunit RuvA n=1 Tax=Marinobacterium sediminicola TaxID=518898 RepID=A0ABY1RXA4_9GAMM|nr:Holliday junction branch migration protein RuvA [Marinobacterium sediminicola]ULG67901.1 Holliday junction branch migration protein RuvA [Marinobacterium sediminicola]SMR71393.1 Holliday junction DNA helicase subunit RuvA [Marinobacterium sediminicola]